MTGCALGSRLAGGTATDVYVLTSPLETPRQHTDTGTILVVYPVRADPGYDVPRIAYVRTPLRLDYYAYSQWADAPGRLLEPLLIRTLEKDGYFRAVVTPSSGLTAGMRLDTEIVTMSHDLSTTPGAGHVTIRVQMTNLHTGEVLATRIFDVSRPAPAENAAGAVTAINDALNRILPEIVAFAVASAPARQLRPVVHP